LAHGYHTLHHWDQWLTHPFLGPHLLQTEQKILTTSLARCMGKQVLLIGVPQQISLFDATIIPCHTLLSPLLSRFKTTDLNMIESDFQELAIMTGSVDLVLLPHTLEFLDNPRRLLAEACRVVKPEGLIAICGFNPYSAWNLKKKWDGAKTTEWLGHFIRMHEVKHWLQLADFELEQHHTCMFRPPIKQEHLYQKLSFMEKLGAHCWPLLGGVYILIARAKVIPLTPIRWKWKQPLRNIRVSTPLSG